MLTFIIDPPSRYESDAEWRAFLEEMLRLKKRAVHIDDAIEVDRQIKNAQMQLRAKGFGNYARAWDESEHPRDEHGRWTDAGEGGDEVKPSDSGDEIRIGSTETSFRNNGASSAFAQRVHQDALSIEPIVAFSKVDSIVTSKGKDALTRGQYNPSSNSISMFETGLKGGDARDRKETLIHESAHAIRDNRLSSSQNVKAAIAWQDDSTKLTKAQRSDFSNAAKDAHEAFADISTVLLSGSAEAGSWHESLLGAFPNLTQFLQTYYEKNKLISGGVIPSDDEHGGLPAVSLPGFSAGVKTPKVPTFEARKEVMERWYVESPIQSIEDAKQLAPHQQTLNKDLRDIASTTTGVKFGKEAKHKAATEKGIARILKKAADRRGRISAVGDLIRGTLVIDRPGQVGQIVDKLVEHNYEVAVEPPKLTREFYADVALNVRDSSGVIGEIQIMEQRMIDAKAKVRGDPDWYEIARESKPPKGTEPGGIHPDPVKYAEATAKMREIYGAVLDSYPREWQAFFGWPEAKKDLLSKSFLR